MTMYLLPTIQNELIELLGKKVKHLILEEIKAAKYFSILLDSTPDVSLINQMALIVRYIKVDRNYEHTSYAGNRLTLLRLGSGYRDSKCQPHLI